MDKYGDGRPMETDVFLVKLMEKCDDHYDYDFRWALKCWIEGDWSGAIEFLEVCE